MCNLLQSVVVLKVILVYRDGDQSAQSAQSAQSNGIKLAITRTLFVFAI